MLLRALLCEVKGLTPEAKYLLARFIQCFGVTAPAELGVKELAKQFGLSDRQVSEALHVLLVCNVLACSSVPEGRGRPKRQFSLQKEFLRSLNKSAPAAGSPYEGVIEQLLRHESSGCLRVADAVEQKAMPDTLASLRARRQPGRLSVVNRLLLSVLLCHADAFGAVRSLGTSELRAITGLGSESLKHRVHRLIAQGYIRAYIPGATSGTLFGKVKGTYVLNLHHPELYNASLSISLLISVNLVEQTAVFGKEAEALYSGEGLGGLLEQLAGFFRARECRMVAPLLQSRLELYASAMLTECWSQLPVRSPFAQSPAADFMPELRNRIAADLRSDSKIREEVEGRGQSHRALLVDRIFKEAFRVACQIKLCFMRIDAIPLDDMAFLVLPPYSERVSNQERRLCMTVLAVPKKSTAVPGCYLTSGQAGFQCIESEPELPVGKRYVDELIAMCGVHSRSSHV